MLHTKTYLRVHVYLCGVFYHFIPCLQCTICISFISFYHIFILIIMGGIKIPQSYGIRLSPRKYFAAERFVTFYMNGLPVKPFLVAYIANKMPSPRCIICNNFAYPYDELNMEILCRIYLQHSCNCIFRCREHSYWFVHKNGKNQTLSKFILFLSIFKVFQCAQRGHIFGMKFRKSNNILEGRKNSSSEK